MSLLWGPKSVIAEKSACQWFSCDVERIDRAGEAGVNGHLKNNFHKLRRFAPNIECTVQMHSQLRYRSSHRGKRCHVANCLERRSSPGRDITSPYEKSMVHSAKSGAMSLKLSTTAVPVPPVIRLRVSSRFRDASLGCSLNLLGLLSGLTDIVHRPSIQPITASSNCWHRWQPLAT